MKALTPLRSVPPDDGSVQGRLAVWWSGSGYEPDQSPDAPSGDVDSVEDELTIEYPERLSFQPQDEN